ncbi:MAG: hypothetical protein KBD50_01765 [Candidatus Pacebacteria bacterium]|nr:hypothetical protein [Candidatus Paceibacterota bacterium]
MIRLSLQVLGCVLVLSAFAYAATNPIENPYELRRSVPSQAGQVDRTHKTNLDLFDMPLGIVFINEDERPAVEGPLPAYRAHQLAEQKYPDADPTIFIEGTAEYDYALRLWVDIYRSHYQLYPVEEWDFAQSN